MAVIKVTYNQISRRFDISSNTTWNTLESQLRSLFNLPTNSSISLSYTDEDGDAITLSSDLELFEVLSSVRNNDYNNSSSSNNNYNGSVLKFVLDVHEYNREISRESDNSWVLEGINNDNNDNNDNDNNDNNDNDNNDNNDNDNDNDSSSDESEREYNDNSDKDDNNDNGDSNDNDDNNDNIDNIDNIDNKNKNNNNNNNKNDIEAYFINNIPEQKEKNAEFTTDHNREREEYEEYKPLNENKLHVTITEEAEEPTFEPNIFSNDLMSQNSNNVKNVPPKQQQKIFIENQQLPKPETIGSSSKSNREENNKQEDKNKDQKSSPQGSPYNRRHLFIGSRLPLFVHPLSYNHSRFSPFGHHNQPSYSHTLHSSFSDSEILCPRFSSNPRFNSNNNCCKNNSNNNCIIVLAFKGIVKAILSILLFITLIKLFFVAFCPLLILFLLGKLWTRISFNNLRPYPESSGFGRCHSISIHCKNDNDSEGEEKEEEEDNELRYFSRRRFGGPPKCHRSQFWQQESKEFKRRERQQQRNDCESEINKKLETLKSMGFNLNDEILKELVKRSNGNLERVVERLLASSQ
ncbi:hypothetical protein Glove_481g28 [Diversispora epigaea]|uniref:UBA domain-containing protein n=1 Tax=Diversispora epigaea TaxID=1348612 RepID=A0A397GK10_9GLOM|nr:hypothetical protein Glove_481g28 [Diversispora epigaea]